jgi:hypothetical protein
MSTDRGAESSPFVMSTCLMRPPVEWSLGVSPSRPFLVPKDREPIYRFPNELPIAGAPSDGYATTMACHNWLLETEMPKIFFHATPGVFIPPLRADFYREHLESCRTVVLGRATIISRKIIQTGWAGNRNVVR